MLLNLQFKLNITLAADSSPIMTLLTSKYTTPVLILPIFIIPLVIFVAIFTIPVVVNANKFAVVEGVVALYILQAKLLFIVAAPDDAPIFKVVAVLNKFE